MQFDADAGSSAFSYGEEDYSQGTSVSEEHARVDHLKAGKRISPLMAAFRGN